MLSRRLLICRVLSCSSARLRPLRKPLRFLLRKGVAASLRLQLAVRGRLVVVFQWHSPLTLSCCAMGSPTFEAAIGLACLGSAATLIEALLLRVDAASHHIASMMLVLLVAIAHALTTGALVVRWLIFGEVIVARSLVVATLGWRATSVATLALTATIVLLLGLALATTMVVVASIVALCVAVVRVVALSEHCSLVLVRACLLQVCFLLSLWFGL